MRYDCRWEVERLAGLVEEGGRREGDVTGGVADGEGEGEA